MQHFHKLDSYEEIKRFSCAFAVRNCFGYFKKPKFLEILFSIIFLCSVKFRRLSAMTPRNFKEVDLSISQLLNLKTGSWRGEVMSV